MNAMEDLKAYVDGELSPERRTEVEAAMMQDESLRREMEEFRVLSRLLGDCVVEPEPVGMEQVLATLEKRRPSGFFHRLFTDRRQYGWAWALTLFVVIAIVPVLFPVFAQSKDAARATAGFAESKAAVAPSAGGESDGLQGQTTFGLSDGERMKGGPEAGGGFGDTTLPGAPMPAHGGNIAGGTGFTTNNGTDRIDKAKAGKSRSIGQDTGVLGKAPAASMPPARQFGKPMLIRTGDLSVQVKSVRQSLQQATDQVKALGGFVESSNSNSDEDTAPTANATLRVPVDHFDDAMNRLRKLGKVLSDSMNGQDVTAQVADDEGKLKEMRAEEESYLEMLRQTRHIDDTLAVRDRLDEVRQNIASVQSELKAMKNQATYSTITLALSQTVPAPAQAKDPTWFETAWQGAVERASGAGKWLAEVGMNLVLLAPIWLPIVVGLWWLGRRNRMAR